MKKVIFGSILALMSITAFADNTSTSTTTTVTTPSNSTAAATNAGVGNGDVAITYTSPADVTQQIEYSGTQTIKNVPSVNGPPLTTSNDTCMGSTTGSFNIAGLGIGGGSTWVDVNCKRLKNSRELWNMGMKAASLALLCLDPDNRDALEETGFICPKKK
jgi:hypothetical protein